MKLNHRKRKYKERDLVKACIEYLSWKGWVVLRNNTGVIVINGKDGKIRAIRNGVKGSSDIIACDRFGRFWAIECKVDSRITEEQEEFLERVNRLGGVGVVVRNIDELMRLVDEKEKES